MNTVTHPIAKRLFEISERKESRLCVAADVYSSEKLLSLANKVGPFTCVLKVHADTVDDWTMETATQLSALSLKHQFLLFEDRKFADIGNTVVAQISGGHYRISKWADIVNAHAISGPGVVDSFRQALTGSERSIGLLLVAQMSSKENLIDENYTKRCVQLAQENQDVCIGFIGQERLDSCGKLLVMTPGVQLKQGSDALGQQYNTLKHVLGHKGSDFIIVGRGVYAAADPAAAACQYQRASWSIQPGT